MGMIGRPVSFSTICWFMIVGAGLTAAGAVIGSPDVGPGSRALEKLIPIALQQAQYYLGALVAFACGITILKGRNWGRFLYVIWNLTAFSVTFPPAPPITGRFLGMVIFIVAVYHLFSPEANIFIFQRNSSQRP